MSERKQKRESVFMWVALAAAAAAFLSIKLFSPLAFLLPLSAFAVFALLY
jgi:hypothetical protein